VHFAVVEVGLGGRFDAVNVLNSEVCVITPIDYDHQQYLGSELTQIAGEKAGVIKNAKAVVLSEQTEVVQEVLLAEVEKHNKRAVFLQGRDFGALDDFLPASNSLGTLLNIRTAHGLYEDLYLNLLGRHQGLNAMLAISAAEELIAQEGCTLGIEALKSALEEVKSPGRLEVLSFDPLIAVDVSHNVQGAEVLAAEFRALLDVDYVIAVVGILESKNADGMFEAYEDLFDSVVLSKNSMSTSRCTEDLKRIALNYFDEDVLYEKDDISQAVDFALDLADDLSADMDSKRIAILITGSAVTVGDALKYLKKPQFQSLLNN
jgi:dihydrofolate synthase/folylpolyglutamate synthase